MEMKKFLLQLGIWVGIVLVSSFLMDDVVSSGLRKTDIRKYATWNDIYKGELHPHLVILGSSQAWCSYNTFILDSVLHLDSYNLGIDGHGIDYQMIRYEEFRRFNAKPKAVIVNCCFIGTLGMSAEDPYEREQFFPFIHNEELISKVAKTKRITWSDIHLPLVRYFGYREELETGIQAFFGKTDFFDGGMHKGYRGNEWNWNRGVVMSKDTLVSASINQESLCLFESFVKMIDKEGIKIVFVKYPIYRPLMEKFIGIEESDSIFASISKEYGIPILDYYHSDINKDSTNFYNPSHLNKKGSELFTFMLCHDLDSLGLLIN